MHLRNRPSNRPSNRCSTCTCRPIYLLPIICIYIRVTSAFISIYLSTYLARTFDCRSRPCMRVVGEGACGVGDRAGAMWVRGRSGAGTVRWARGVDLGWMLHLPRRDSQSAHTVV